MANNGKLLFDEYPLMILPSLATLIGLNEAIVLQQMHYWILSNKRSQKREYCIDEKWWVKASYTKWQEDNFPFWSERTIQRIVASLQNLKLLSWKQPNKAKGDMSKWYSIDYTHLDNLSTPSRQVVMMDDDNLSLSTTTDWRDLYYKETIEETSKETKEEKNIASDDAVSFSIVEKSTDIVEETPIASQPDMPIQTSTVDTSDTEPIGNGAGGAPTYEQVEKIFELGGGLNTLMRQMLQGDAEKKTHKEYNCSPPVLSRELEQWAGWYKIKNPTAHMVKSPAKVQSSIYAFRSQQKAKWLEIDAAIYSVSKAPEQPAPELDAETMAANRAFVDAGINELLNKFSQKRKRGKTNDAA